MQVLQIPLAPTSGTSLIALQLLQLIKLKMQGLKVTTTCQHCAPR